MEKKHYIDMELVKKLMEEKNIDVQTMANSVGLTPKTLKKIFRRSRPKLFNGKLAFSIGKSLRCSDYAPDT